MAQLFTRGGTEREPNAHVSGKPVYRYIGNCPRCGGAGGAERWRHTGWTCYECQGSGAGREQVQPLYTQEQLDKLNAAQAKREAKKAEKLAAQQAALKAEADAKREAWIAAHAELVAGIERHAASSPFLTEMAHAIASRGELTEKQAEAAQRSVERADEHARQAANSQHVGEIGKRSTLTLTVQRVVDITPQPRPYGFGRRYLVISKDAAGNAVLYKGGALFGAEGETVELVATVEEHGEYNGTRQTRIARPRVVQQQAA